MFAAQSDKYSFIFNSNHQLSWWFIWIKNVCWICMMYCEWDRWFLTKLFVEGWVYQINKLSFCNIRQHLTPVHKCFLIWLQMKNNLRFPKWIAGPQVKKVYKWKKCMLLKKWSIYVGSLKQRIRDRSYHQVKNHNSNIALVLNQTPFWSDCNTLYVDIK